MRFCAAQAAQKRACILIGGELLLQLITNGLAMGAIYSLVAIGAVLLYNAAKQLNFAQSEFVMLGAYFMYTYQVLLELPYFISLVLVILSMAVFGLLFEGAIFHPVRNHSRFAFLVLTGLASILIKNLGLNLWGAQPKPLDDLFGYGTIKLFGATIVLQYVYCIAVFIVLISAVYFLLFRTMLGKKMRAVAQNRDVARLMSINTRSVNRATFIIYSILGGLAGTLLAPIFFVKLELGAMVSLFAFSACVIGGFGSIPGAILGGMILGLAEIFVARYISSGFKTAITFAIMLIILYVKPTGLLGEKIKQKL
ncbi:MAG: branched-chain amino acid ABC transporter permease [Eubacteriales bacterium]|nr:branched-chain amino acid ABC transporter permease [Eubacteriales bacterium]